MNKEGHNYHIKKNVLDLQYNKYLQYTNTLIIILLTYLVGIAIAFLTKQLNYLDKNQFLIAALVSAFVISVVVGFLVKFKDALNNITKEIESIEP